MPNVKRLTLEQRTQLLAQWSKGVNQADLSAAFGIAQSSVSYLVRKYVGAEPGKQVTRMMPGTTLRELTMRLEDLLTDLDRLRRDTRSMLALAGAVPAIVPDDRPHNPTAARDALVAAAQSGDLDNGGAIWMGDAVIFNGDYYTPEEFWEKFPNGIAADDDGHLFTFEEAVEMRDENAALDRARMAESEEEDTSLEADALAAEETKGVARTRTRMRRLPNDEEKLRGLSIEGINPKDEGGAGGTDEIDQEFYEHAMAVLAPPRERGPSPLLAARRGRSKK